MKTDKANKIKQFIFLYPIKEYFKFEIENGPHTRMKEELNKFQENYSRLLNQAINLRYRQKGFAINYAVFGNREVSKIIQIVNEDRVIKTRLNFSPTQEELESESYRDSILDELGEVDILRVAGFHLWDCVDKLAKRAYERGIQTLVDEDLTELFKWQSNSRIYPQFKIDSYPSCPPTDDPLGIREEKPWLVQLALSKK